MSLNTRTPIQAPSGGKTLISNCGMCGQPLSTDHACNNYMTTKPTNTVKGKEKVSYILSQAQIEWSYDRFEYKGGWGEYKTRKGWIGLWDRNDYKFKWFKIVGKCLDKYAYIVERNTPIKGYWSNLTKI